MNGKFVCSICGKDYNDLSLYLNCVDVCGRKLQKEMKEAERRAEEVNAYLKDIIKFKSHYERLLNEFKAKYPKEYALNFGEDNTCECDCSCGSDCKCEKEHEAIKPEVKTESIEVSYESNGKDKPTLSAKVNGKDIDDVSIKKLFEDPETQYLARLLGIL